MLELAELTRRYGETLALDELSLAVRPGTLCGFVGPNGAGKTTTMRIVLGVLSADAGTVSFGGQAVDREARTRFGYMPEERGLYPKMPVGEQLEHFARLHGRSAADARAKAASLLERLGIADRAKDRTEGLSLGNQQRVQLAAALVHDPELLVLDDRARPDRAAWAGRLRRGGHRQARPRRARGAPPGRRRGRGRGDRPGREGAPGR